MLIQNTYARLNNTTRRCIMHAFLVNQGAILVTCTVHVDAFLVMGLLAGLFAPTSLLRPPIIVVREAEKLPISISVFARVASLLRCTVRNQEKFFT
jgi:hypothetical protein